MTLNPSIESGSSAGRHLFSLGLLVFLCAKLYLVVPFTYLAGAPRQGDDSYVYLWKGVLASHQYDAASPAMSDIRKFAQPDVPLEEGLVAKQARVVMRTHGALSPLYDQLTALCLNVIGNPKGTIGALEILGVLTMSASIGIFLNALFGARAAGLGLMLMAFVILPHQGISHFIPSTLTLSLGMLAWGLLLKPQTGSSMVVAGVIAALLPGIHPIGKLYAGITALIYGIVLWRSKEPFSWRRWLILALVIGSGIGASIALPAILPFLAPPPTSQLGGISGSDGVAQNFHSAMSLLWETVKKSPHVFAVMTLGLAFTRRFVAPPVAWSVSALFVFLMIGSLLHTLPGYPAELFSRLLVPAVVIASGYGGYLVVEAYKRGAYRRILIVLVFGSVLPMFVYWVTQYAFDQRRPFVIDDALVRQEIALLPRDKPVLYLETDVSLMVALLNGADRLGAIPLPVFRSRDALARVLNEQQPFRAVIQVPNALNTVVAHNVDKLIAQHYGYLFSATDRLRVRALSGRKLSRVFGLIRNPGPEMAIKVSGLCGGTPCGLGGRERNVMIRADSFEWVALWAVPDDPVDELRIILPDSNAWIKGLRSNADDAKVRWPWGDRWEVKFHMRAHKTEHEETLEFSTEELLRNQHAEIAIEFIHPVNPIVSDKSGLVFLRTVYDKNAR